MDILILVGALIVILLGAEAFTNSLEHFGERLGISEGVTGSVFAAIGTALPETMVPLFAIFLGSGSETLRHEVGVGAILGAPLMLSTLAFFLVGWFAAKSRGWHGLLNPEPTGFSRDLAWFNWVFCLGVLATFVPQDLPMVRGAIGIILVLMYVVYLYQTIRSSSNLVDDGHGTEADHPLYITKIGFPDNLLVILFQLGLGLGLIVLGAKGFVYGIEHLAPWLGVSALTLSLLIIPVATELPEKVNSIIWIRRRRDTLAMGNITGAMVFQGSLLPALGIMLTAWVPQHEILMGMAMTLIAAVYLTVVIRMGSLKPIHLVVNGVCYALFVMSVLFW
ncbi:MAG: sodium:calcium antiporter [Nitrospira sp.]|nr:sodium:calcium antiporter [Nitrospira sp.]